MQDLLNDKIVKPCQDNRPIPYDFQFLMPYDKLTQTWQDLRNRSYQDLDRPEKTLIANAVKAAWTYYITGQPDDKQCIENLTCRAIRALIETPGSHQHVYLFTTAPGSLLRI